jgi:CRP-like cAMP-binding protein
MYAAPLSSAFPLTGDFLAGRLRDQFDGADLAFIEDLMGQPRALPDGELLIARGETVRRATVLIDGFMINRIVRDGRRYIVGVHVPGDFVDLHGFALKHLDHDIVAAGPVRIAQVERDRLRDVTIERPSVARALWFATLLDAAINRQWIRNLEALDAPQRIAHLYAELHCRLALIGRNVSRTLRTPFTQTDLADMCGVSAIHANRAVARIRQLGLGEIRRGDLYTADWNALESYAGFEPGYLYGQAGPSS